MAKYAISPEGVSALQGLQNSILQTKAELDASNAQLINDVNGDIDGLGVYAKDILEMARRVVIASKKSEAGIGYLTSVGIPKQIALISKLLNFDSENGGDDDWPDPPVKVKVLRR